MNGYGVGRAASVDGRIGQEVAMGEVPRVRASELERRQHDVPGLHEIRAGLPGPLEHRAEPAAALVRHRAAERGGREANQVLQPSLPLLGELRAVDCANRAGQPLADDEHAGRMDDRVEGLAVLERRFAECAIESLRDVLHGDLVAERHVAAQVDRRRVEAARREDLRPSREARPLVAVAMHEDDRACRHRAYLQQRCGPCKRMRRTWPMIPCHDSFE